MLVPGKDLSNQLSALAPAQLSEYNRPLRTSKTAPYFGFRPGIGRPVRRPMSGARRLRRPGALSSEIPYRRIVERFSKNRQKSHQVRYSLFCLDKRGRPESVWSRLSAPLRSLPEAISLLVRSRVPRKWASSSWESMGLVENRRRSSIHRPSPCQEGSGRSRRRKSCCQGSRRLAAGCI